MDEQTNDLHVRATLNICRLYPVWRQDGSEDCKAWISENKACLNEKIATLKAGGDPQQDEGWPCPHAWKTKTDKVESVIDELEEVKAKIDDTKPPEELAGFFDGKPHGIAAADMLRELNDLTNLVQMKLATDEQREKQRILSRHAPYLRSKAVDLV